MYHLAVSLLQGLVVGFLALVVVTGAIAQDVSPSTAAAAPGFMEAIPAWVWAAVVMLITFLANAWQLAVLRRADTVKDSLEAVGERLETQFGNLQVAQGTFAKEQAVHGVQIEGLDKRVERLEEV